MTEFEVEVQRPGAAQPEQARGGWFQDPIDCLLALGEEQDRLGKREAARQTYEFILKLDPFNEQATWGLCETNEDWWEAQKILKNMVEERPESRLGKAMLLEAQARCAEFEELREIVGATLYRKLLRADREKRFAEQVCPQRPAPVKLLGKILVEVGYINHQQLETTLNLQTMLLRYDNHQPIGKMLLDSGYVTEQQLNEVLQVQELEEGRAHYNWSRRLARAS